MDTIKFGLFLKSLRAERGLTQEELAERLGVAGRTISRWETGANLPDLDVLVILADLFEVDVRELIDGERKAVSESDADEVSIKKAMEYGIERERIMIGRIMLTVVLGIASWIVSLIAALLFIDEVRGGAAVTLFSLACFVIYSLCMLSARRNITARGLISVLIGGFSAEAASNLLVVAVFFGTVSYHNYGLIGLWYVVGIYIAVFLLAAVVVSLVNRWRK